MKSHPATAADSRKAAPEIERPDPLDARNPPPQDRYCDLVMTGGVIDGVVYPWAVMELAREYHFKSIGGTSVGAMAAALTAAAEYGRRYGSLNGFNEVLLKLPDKLAEPPDGATKGTTLFSLFQPQKAMRRLFDVFVSALSEDPVKGKTARVMAMLRAILHIYRREGLLGMAFGLVLPLMLRADTVHALPYLRLGAWSWPDSVAAVPIVLLALLLGGVCALAFIAWRIYHDLAYALPANNFGLCTGVREDASTVGPESLIEWLHRGIQAAAGKPLDRPLTFRDLWNAPGGPPQTPLPPARRTKKPRSIDLRMVTTNLTHGRPYILPVEDQTSRLFFRIDELANYFPQSIIDHLVEHSRPYKRESKADPDASRVPNDIRELPDGELPIVVAARLSLCFPVLFSSVPLWAIDYEPRRDERNLQRCWFSDGGICSNFPIHLFDAAVPRWPTFGIFLRRKSKFWGGENVWVTQYHNEGYGDSWNRFDEAGDAPRRLWGFLGSIVWSAKDWNDKTTMRMPGVRDRVARISLDEGEAGLNLRLKGELILDYASRYGLQAGKKLVNKFVDPSNAPSTAWNEHRWVRFNAMVVALRERFEGLRIAANSSVYTKPLADQIEEAKGTPPLAERRSKGLVLTEAQAQALKRALHALDDLEAELGKSAIAQPYEPLPTPTVRLRPPL